jgi:hypothetical protein
LISEEKPIASLFHSGQIRNSSPGEFRSLYKKANAVYPKKQVPTDVSPKGKNMSSVDAYENYNGSAPVPSLYYEDIFLPLGDTSVGTCFFG